VLLIRGSGAAARASAAWLAGDVASAVPLCQSALATVFRADVRARALHVLGLTAEANGDFLEAADLFARAEQTIPAMTAEKYKRHARALMLSHRALALTALGRLDEADFVARRVSAIYATPASTALDIFTDDAAFGSFGVGAAMRDLEPGRDPRALVALASAVVLSARGMPREAVDLLARERYVLQHGLLPREKALIASVELRAGTQLGGGPMRLPGAAAPLDPWAERVLPAFARG
jgi:tetratricopeptide (TPR) repeat protein